MNTNPNPQVSPNYPEQVSPEMENGARSSTGLVVAGLVTIVGSWIGMAAYLDYRLNAVEQNQQKVVSAVDSTRASLNEQIQSLAEKNRASLLEQMNAANRHLGEQIKDTSGVLAKGILDLTQKEDDHYAAAMGILNDNKTLLGNAVESSQSAQNAVLAAVQGLDKNLTAANQDLREHLDSATGALQELVKQADQNSAARLNDLAASLSANAGQMLTETQQFSAELTALARQVSDLQSEVGSSREAMQAMNTSLPGWQEASDQKITALQSSAQASQDTLRKDLEALQQKINEIGQRLDSTAESMMKALYLTSEGLEGARVELKSEFENSRNQTTAEIQNLVQSVRGITETLEKLKNVDAQSSLETQSRLLPPQDTLPLQSLTASLQEITEKAQNLRNQISSQVDEAKARTQILMARNDEAGQTQALVEILSQFTSLADLAGGQLQSFVERLGFISGTVKTLDSQPQASSLTVLENPETSAPASTGLNPEERPVDTKTAPVNE
ncbi:MAG: hypothetical protein ACE15F_02045 [bacterium]